MYERIDRPLAPISLNWLLIEADKPCTMDTTAITEATPMMMPSEVKKLRKPWARMLCRAERRLSRKLYIERLPGARRVEHIALHAAVMQANRAPAMGGDVRPRG